MSSGVSSDFSALGKRGEERRGRHLLMDLLGRGTQGEVYVARNLLGLRGDMVALKQQESAHGDFTLEREAEFLLLCALAAPRFIEFFQEGPKEVLVMELLGPSLGDEVKKQTACRFSLKTVALIAQQVLRLLEFVHCRGVVFRDTKPDNYLHGTGGRLHHITMCDFGLADRPVWNTAVFIHKRSCRLDADSSR